MNFHKKVIKELARKEGVTKKEIRRRIQEEVIDYCVRAIKINH